MNIKSIALCAALFCVIAGPTMAAEYKYYSVDARKPGYIDGNKSTRNTYTTKYEGRYFLWFGNPFECSGSGSSASSPCKYTDLKSKTVTTSWKAGISGSIKTTFGTTELGTVLSGEFGKSVSDTDTYSREYTFDAGITALPSTSIDRQRVFYKYKGGWVRVQDNVNCQWAVWKKCDKYQWNSTVDAGALQVLVAMYSEQTFTFLTYKNGNRPSSYRVSNDGWSLRVEQ
jgi:hypothetical protein